MSKTLKASKTGKAQQKAQKAATTPFMIRDFPSPLRRALKVRAAREGVTLKQLVVDLLTKQVAA